MMMNGLARPWTSDEEVRPSGIITGAANIPMSSITGRSSAEFNPSRMNTEGNKSSKSKTK